MPSVGRFEYDRAEWFADGLIHVIGLLFAIGGAAVLIATAWPPSSGTEFAAILLYALSLIVSVGLSAAYNMWPISPTKWTLRRYDHAAIFFLIAGTYSPFIAKLEQSATGTMLAASIWLISGVGIAIKLIWPGKGDRAAILMYLAAGWLGVFLIDDFFDVLPSVSVQLIITGGVLYTVGIIFHLWERLRFQNAIWHGFVLVATVCLYSAVIGSVAA